MGLGLGMRFGLGLGLGSGLRLDDRLRHRRVRATCPTDATYEVAVTAAPLESMRNKSCRRRAARAARAARERDETRLAVAIEQRVTMPTWLGLR